MVGTPVDQAQLYDRAVFTESERRDIRDELVAAARSDKRIEAAALVGSAARDSEDQWSDIDLALRLAPGLDPEEIAAEWTAHLSDIQDVIAHLDIWSGPALYRVFLLASSLQIDLSFWPSDTFAESGGPFRLLFGQANEPTPSSARPAADLIGMGWLYALHARSSIARRRTLQALYMINGIRDQVISLACLRHGLHPDQGRGVDDLPKNIKQELIDTVPRGLDPVELNRSFARVSGALLIEVRHCDAGQATRLEAPLQELIRTASLEPEAPLLSP